MIFPLTIMPGDWAALNTSLDYLQQRSVSDWPGTFPDSALSFVQRAANLVWCGPASGNPAVPTWRALVSADIPALDASKITTGQLALARGGTHADLSATGGTSFALLQESVGANVTVRALAAADIPALPASKITSGQLSLAQGGTGADLSATGGANNVLKQSSAGAAITSGTIASTNLSDTANIVMTNTVQNIGPAAAKTFKDNVTIDNTNAGANASDLILDNAGVIKFILGCVLTGSNTLITGDTVNDTGLRSQGGSILMSVDSGTTAALRIVTGTSNLEIAKLVSKYNGITTAGQGVPVIVASTTNTAVAAALSTTIFTGPASANLYDVSVYAHTTTVGTGTVSISVLFNDGTATHTQTATLDMTTLGGAGFAGAAVLSFPALLGASQTFQWGNGAPGGGGKYDLFAVIKRLT